jgi:hypothetical protein
MKLQFDPVGQQIRGPDSADDFSHVIVPTPVGTPGVATDSNLYDAIITTTVSTGVKTNFKINVTPSLVNSNRSLSFTSLTPTIAAVDNVGKVAWVLDGNAVISVKSGGIERQITQAIAISGVATTKRANAYRTDAGMALGSHCSAQIAALILGKTAQGNVNSTGGTQTMWASNNHDTTAPVVTRNSGFFGAGLNNLTAIGAMNSSNEDVRAHPPVLVTARHIFGATHYQTCSGIIGNKVVFVRTDGTLQTETLIDKWSDDDDHWIGLLSNPITGCVPFQIMPTGWTNYLKSIDTNFGNVNGDLYGMIPILSRVIHRPDGNVDERVNVCGFVSLTNVNPASTFIGLSSPAYDTAAPIVAWWGNVVGGDSGGPIMAVVNNNLVLLATFHYASGGASIERYASTYETQMRRMAALVGDNTAYAFTRADLNAFTAY